MNTFITDSFKKHYKKRIAPNENLKNRFQERRQLFLQDSTNPLLKDHALAGKKLGLRAFSITGDIRVVYYIHNSSAYFVDIGTHNQVYR